MNESKLQAFSRHYLSDFVYGANDGIITTFAVVSGAAGAGLSETVIIILGIANLIADGFSMGASRYLSATSERALDPEADSGRSAVADGMATFAAFVVAGALPLMPFIFGVASGSQFAVSVAATGLSLFLVGSARSYVIDRSAFVAGLEMLLVGGIAAFIAYGLGWLVESWVSVGL